MPPPSPSGGLGAGQPKEKTILFDANKLHSKLQLSISNRSWDWNLPQLGGTWGQQSPLLGESGVDPLYDGQLGSSYESHIQDFRILPQPEAEFAISLLYSTLQYWNRVYPHSPPGGAEGGHLLVSIWRVNGVTSHKKFQISNYNGSLFVHTTCFLMTFSIRSFLSVNGKPLPKNSVLWRAKLQAWVYERNVAFISLTHSWDCQ